MEFVYPSFLFALSVLAIPIIIHLFNFRKYKTIKFTNVRFLRNIKEQTQSQSRLKHLLILLCRILALSCLVFAFAQPFIPVEDSIVSKGKKAISIYLDNSFSMEAKATEGSLFNLAKNRALHILDAYDESDQFQILTNDFVGKHQRFVNKKTFINYLQEVELSPNVKTIEQVYNRQKDLLKEFNYNSRQFFHISDLQKSTYQLNKIKNDSSRIEVLPVQAGEVSNLYIDSVWFASPIRKAGDQVSLKIKIVNDGDKNLSNVPIHLEINNKAKTPQVFSIAANESSILEMVFTSNDIGWIRGHISIKDYPVSFDDDFYFSYEQAETISILHIHDNFPSTAIPALFDGDQFFKYSPTNYKQLNYSELDQYQILILEELDELPTGLLNELKKFMQKGGSVVLFPPSDINLQQYNQALQQMGAETFSNEREQNLKVSELNLRSELFEGVFDKKPENINLPTVKSYYPLRTFTSSDKENILSLQNGDALLNKYGVGNGKLYLFATSLQDEQSNLTSHALFVPLVYNMALLSQPKQDLYYFLGDKLIGINTQEVKETPFHLIGKGLDFIPGQRIANNQLVLDLHNQIAEAGFYELVHNGETIAILALNFNRDESELEVFEPDELQVLAEQNGLTNFRIINETEESLSNALRNFNRGIPLWKYFIIGTLFFLALEILFLRTLR